jgi:hypothetical protein
MAVCVCPKPTLVISRLRPLGPALCAVDRSSISFALCAVDDSDDDKR